MLLDRLAAEDAAMEAKAKRDFCKKRQYFEALTNQLEDATSKKAQKEEEFGRDKTMVDEIIATIKEEEIRYENFIM